MRFRKNLHFVLTFVPGPAVKTNRGYGPQPLCKRLLAGWGGSAHSQECLVPKTGDYAFPAHLQAHRSFPGFLNAGARARAREHKHSHTRTRACAEPSSSAPPSCPSPVVGQTPSSQNRKRAEPKKKNASDPQDFLPANFPSNPLGRLIQATSEPLHQRSTNHSTG